MTHYRKLYDRDALGACDFEDDQGRELPPQTFTITKVVGLEITSPGGGGKKKRQPVIFLQGTPKKFVVNATNGATIAALYGMHVEAWVGKRITLYPAQTKFGGKPVMGIRVQNREPPPNAPPGRLRAEPAPAMEAEFSGERVMPVRQQQQRPQPAPAFVPPAGNEPPDDLEYDPEWDRRIDQ